MSPPQSSVLGPQSSRAAWRRNFYVIWLATFASVFGSHLAMPFIPLFIQRDLGVSDPGAAAAWAGLVNACAGFSMAIMAPIWGVLADRHGRKAMLVRAQFALALSNAAASFVLAPWQLVGVRGLQGGFSGLATAARALAASTVPRERLPYAMGLIQSAAFMGQTLGPTVGGIVGGALGFRTAFFTTGCINTAAGVLTAMYVREGVVPASMPEEHTTASGLKSVLASAPLATLVGILFLSSVASSSIRPVLALLLGEMDSSGEVVQTAGLAFGALGVAGAAASLAASRVAGEGGLGRLLIVAGVGGAASNLLIGTASAPWMVVALLLGVGSCQGLLVSSATSLVSLHAPPDRQGTAFGVTASVQALAQGVGPLVGGLVASAYSLRGAFGTAGSILVIAALVGMALRGIRTATVGERP